MGIPKIYIPGICDLEWIKVVAESIKNSETKYLYFFKINQQDAFIKIYENILNCKVLSEKRSEMCENLSKLKNYNNIANAKLPDAKLEDLSESLLGEINTIDSELKNYSVLITKLVIKNSLSDVILAVKYKALKEIEVRSTQKLYVKKRRITDIKDRIDSFIECKWMEDYIDNLKSNGTSKPKIQFLKILKIVFEIILAVVYLIVIIGGSIGFVFLLVKLMNPFDFSPIVSIIALTDACIFLRCYLFLYLNGQTKDGFRLLRL